MKLFGSRPTKEPKHEVVADLDAMIAEPVAFRFQGKTHLIRPVSTVELLKYAQAGERVKTVMKDSDASKDEVIDSAFQVIASVCDTIRRKDMEAMTQPQVGALLNLVVECVTGKVYARVDSEKKKTAS